jgi:hypothetical protein
MGNCVSIPVWSLFVVAIAAGASVTAAYLWARDIGERLHRAELGNKVLDCELKFTVDQLAQSNDRATELSLVVRQGQEENARLSEQLRQALESKLSTFNEGFDKGVEHGKQEVVVQLVDDKWLSVNKHFFSTKISLRDFRVIIVNGIVRHWHVEQKNLSKDELDKFIKQLKELLGGLGAIIPVLGPVMGLAA